MTDILLIKTSTGRLLTHSSAFSAVADSDPEVVLDKHREPGETLVWSAIADSAILRVPGLQRDVDVSLVNGEVVVSSLSAAKRAAITVTDKKTVAGIAAGFTHAAKVFSLSVEAQLSLNGVWAVRTDTNIYPIIWPTKDDTDSLSIVDQTAFEAFFADAFQKVRADRDAGAGVKVAIQTAANTAAVTAALAADVRP